MEDAYEWASFPVIFSDGKKEINFGNIEVCSTWSFKIFQQVMGQKIGLYPNQILIYLVQMTNSQENQTRIPVTRNANLELIVQQKECFFYVNPKKSRRSIDMRQRPILANEFDYGGGNSYYNNKKIQAPADNAVLLRRNQTDVDLRNFQYSGYQFPFDHTNFPKPYVSPFNDRLQNLLTQKKNLQRVMAVPLIDIRKSDPDMGPGFILENQAKAVCKECAEANADKAADFHLCVNDEVIEKFKTTAGPIAPPIKTSA